MIKAILVLFLKLPLALKGLLSTFITLLETTIVRFIDDIGFHVLQPIRAIRFPDVREFLSENIVTIFLFIILSIIIYLNFKNREEKV
tara:strand:- start:234 stop:494 length:261 start_codon:yes stop_codon:yes gene_type:complete